LKRRAPDGRDGDAHSEAYPNKNINTALRKNIDFTPGKSSSAKTVWGKQRQVSDQQTPRAKNKKMRRSKEATNRESHTTPQQVRETEAEAGRKGKGIFIKFRRGKRST